MKKLPFHLSILISGIFICSCHHSQHPKDNLNTSGLHNQLSEKEKNEGWQLLFDGSTTNGWRGFKEKNIPDGWIAKEGNLVALGKGGDLGGDIVSEELFEDFDLYLEWSIESGGNSGIMFHVL